jgi:hypothetical protein
LSEIPRAQHVSQAFVACLLSIERMGTTKLKA